MWKVVFLSLSVVGCATTYKDLKADKIKDGQGVAIAHIQVLYNDKPFTKHCGVCMNSVNGPCQMLQDDGIVFIPIEKGEGSLRRLVCQDVSPQHYNLEGATFAVADGVTYIGDVTFRWTNKGGFKMTTLFALVGALIDEASNDGKLEMTVTESKKSRDSLLSVYKSQLSLSSVEARSSLVKVGR